VFRDREQFEADWTSEEEEELVEEEGEAVRAAREELVDGGESAQAGESAGGETQGTLLSWLRAGAAAPGAHGRLLGVAATKAQAVSAGRRREPQSAAPPLLKARAGETERNGRLLLEHAPVSLRL
jgi:hypothetical protein